MRVDVKKFLFIGARKDKEMFFSLAQQHGFIEFINPQGIRNTPLPKDAEKYLEAIKVLRSYVHTEQEVKKDILLAENTVNEILFEKKSRDHAEEKKQILLQEIERVAPFGNFIPEWVQSIEKESGFKVRFWYARSNKNASELSSELIFISSDEGTDYFITISKDPISIPDVIETHIPEPLGKLKKRLESLETTISICDDRLRKLTRYDRVLHWAFIQKLNEVSFLFASDSASLYLDEQLFIIEGWIPENKRSHLHAVCDPLNVEYEEVLQEAHDIPPTYLENKGIHRVGEDLVHIFDVPSYTDKDPSLWVLGAFSLFFAMIVGDGGYGLIFLATALLLKYKIKSLKSSGKRFANLVAVLAVACIAWGFLTNAFFGIHFSEQNAFKKYSPLHYLVEKKATYHFAQKDDVYQSYVEKMPELAHAENAHEFLVMGSKIPEDSMEEKFTNDIMFELALLVGSIHIILGMMRYLRRNLHYLGWILFIIGGYLYIPYYLQATSILNFALHIDKAESAHIGLYLLFGGLTLAMIATLFKHGPLGIFECMFAVQIFGDIMSYLRIYALGFAGAIVATISNQAYASVPLIFGILLVILGHSLNILLSIMGGVIHGLRLNFLEWYHYSFEGGGKKFKPLELHIFE
jgi:V/A-type H+-transporting ATPase subunit I